MTEYDYTKLLLEHFRNPKNLGKLENYDIVTTEKSPKCGDTITFYIKFDQDKIKDISFESFGCAANIASSSVLSVMAKGKTIEEVKKITQKDIVKELGGLPSEKFHCSALAITTINSAIK